MTSSHFADYVGALSSLRDAGDDHRRALADAARVGADELQRAQSGRERIRSTAETLRRDLDWCRVTADRLRVRVGDHLPDPGPVASPRSMDELGELLSGVHADCESTRRDLDWVDRMAQQSKDQPRPRDLSPPPAPVPVPDDSARTPVGNVPPRIVFAVLAAVAVLLLIAVLVVVLV